MQVGTFWSVIWPVISEGGLQADTGRVAGGSGWQLSHRTQTEYPQKLPGAWAMGAMLGVCIRALPVRGPLGSGRSIGPSIAREVAEVVLELSPHGTQAERKYAPTGL